YILSYKNPSIRIPDFGVQVKNTDFFSTHFFKISFIKLNVPTSLTNQQNNADQSLTFGKDNLEKSLLEKYQGDFLLFTII
ncbi:hypothetical protein, partial [Enterococcus faecalis]|uniref:hypothetical protein n=1 Tax=Enterococcus faecalis TaxID=1351 RepID=UPI00066506B1